MATQEAFIRATQDGAGLVGLTCGESSKVPQKVPQTLQDNGGKYEIAETINEKDPANSWVCLAMSLADLPLSTPARVRTIRKTKRKLAAFGARW